MYFYKSFAMSNTKKCFFFPLCLTMVMVYTAGQLHAMREIIGFDANFVNGKQDSSWRLFDPKALNVNTQVLLLDPHGIKELLHDFKYMHVEKTCWRPKICKRQSS